MKNKDFNIASHYTGLKADLIHLTMMKSAENLTENQKERLSRYLEYTEYLLNKTYFLQSINNKDLKT